MQRRSRWVSPVNDIMIVASLPFWTSIQLKMCHRTFEWIWTTWKSWNILVAMRQRTYSCTSLVSFLRMAWHDTRWESWERLCVCHARRRYLFKLLEKICREFRQSPVRYDMIKCITFIPAYAVATVAAAAALSQQDDMLRQRQRAKSIRILSRNAAILFSGGNGATIWRNSCCSLSQSSTGMSPSRSQLLLFGLSPFN